jgi:hypothetical protein
VISECGAISRMKAEGAQSKVPGICIPSASEFSASHSCRDYPIYSIQCLLRRCLDLCQSHSRLGAQEKIVHVL